MCEDLDKFCGLFPENVKCVAVIMPSSRSPHDIIDCGVKMLERAGIKVKVGKHLLEPVGENEKGLPLAERIEDFLAAWNDPEVDMIWATRGGWGAIELIQSIDWKALPERRELILQGFSDITLLNHAMLSQGRGYPMAGLNLGTATKAAPDALEQMRDIFHRRSPKPVALQPLRSGDASGLAIGGHLDRIARIIKMQFRPDVKGRVIFVECVSRSIAELTEDFAAVAKDGYWDQASALVFCHFNRFPDEKEAEKVNDMLDAFAKMVKVPAYKGFPFGHEPRNYSIDFQSKAVIKNNLLTFEFEK